MSRSDCKAGLERARKLVAKGKLTRAIDAYRRVLELDPSDARTLLRIAELCVKTGARQDATEAFLEAARNFHRKGFRDRAIAAYERALTLAPRAAGVHMEVGELLVAAVRIPEAKQHFQAAIAAYCAKDRVREMLDASCRLVELSPDDYELRARLAKMYADNGFPDQAAKHYEAAWNLLRERGALRAQLRVGCAWLAVAPDDRELRMRLGELYLELRDPMQALRLLREPYRQQPDDPPLLHCLARALDAIGQPEKANQARARRAQLLGESPPRPPTAAGSERLPSVDAREAPAEALIQLALEARTDRERALAYLHRALTLEPGNTQALQLAKQIAGLA